VRHVTHQADSWALANLRLLNVFWHRRKKQSDIVIVSIVKFIYLPVYCSIQ